MIRNTGRSFGLVAIVFHWTMAALFFVQFWIGLTLESELNRTARALLLSRHISLGFLILTLWIMRAIWTAVSPRPALPEGMAESERKIAKAVHALLFWLLGVTPLVGWAIVSTASGEGGHVITFFGLFDIPTLPIETSVRSVGIWTVLHAFLAYAMFFLSGVHTLAAMRHQFTLKDRLLTRMVVPGSSLKSGR